MKSHLVTRFWSQKTYFFERKSKFHRKSPSGRPGGPKRSQSIAFTLVYNPTNPREIRFRGSPQNSERKVNGKKRSPNSIMAAVAQFQRATSPKVRTKLYKKPTKTTSKSTPTIFKSGSYTTFGRLPPLGRTQRYYQFNND